MTRNEVRKLVSLIFIGIAAVTCLFYSIISGVYSDEYEGVMYDWWYIFSNFMSGFWPILGIGLIMFFLPDGKK